jgi:ATP-dependent DNA helicase RecG
MTGTNIQVEIHLDRIVISNPGGLPEGYDLSKLGTKSFRRNELIADLFSRMDIAERFGSGIKRVRQLLKEANCEQPKYESDMFFTVTFTRPEQHNGLEQIQTRIKKNTIRKLSQDFPVKSKRPTSATTTTEVILEILKRNPNFSQEKIASKVNLSVEGVRYQIKKLQKQRRITRIGSRKTGSWKVLKS